MSHDVIIPAVGESITEGTIARWLVADGAIVTETTPLFELETDKISTEVQAGAAGKVTFSAKEGDTLAIGTVIASIDTSAAGTAPQSAPPPAPAVKEAPKSAAQNITSTFTAPPPAATMPLSPAVKQFVADKNIDPATVTGTGKDGRITKGDLLQHEAKPAAASTPATTAPSTDSGKGVTRKRMSTLRQRIAQRLVQAQRTAAILTTFNEVDMSACMELRKRFKEGFEKKHGIGLGFMSFFTVAAVKALQKYPLINSQIDGTDVVSFDGIHMGVAVGTEKGLVVPVLRHAEKMSFAEIEKAIKGAALKARDGKLTIDDMQGGTFTITNGGVYGSLMSTPIINPPQSGILGMHSIKQRPMAVDGQVVIRPMMYIALSYDHRIVDGAEAVGFLVRIKELIEEPEKLLFDL